MGSIVGGEGIVFRPSKVKNESTKTSLGSITNKYLWQASLEILRFIPLSSTDINSGIIITDWYSPKETTKFRFKINIFIKDSTISPNAIDIKIFEQIFRNGYWIENDNNMKNIEQKWQKIWHDENAFVAINNSTSPKYYILEMLPYPSGKIHMGHLRNYSIGDCIARFMRSKNFNVLHPMGWDAFGLPAENAAISNNSHPMEWTYINIDTMRDQLKSIGLSYDWLRELTSCDPDYYKHEQKFFLELYKKDLAYQKESLVNWDPVDKTVLANEQVIDGRGWRSGALIEKRYLKQWFLRITNYAEELLSELSNLTAWPHNVRTMQEKWIGKSHGLNFNFKRFFQLNQKLSLELALLLLATIILSFHNW
ncbi:unnamed protein product, partial [Oppiella nova]